MTNIITSPQERTRFLKFMAVGVFGAVVDFGIMNLFSKLFSLTLVWAGTVSFTCAVVSNFIWNRYWTYNDVDKVNSMNKQPQRPIVVPIYTSRGDAEAFLAYPYLHNRLGEWIGWLTSDGQVYSVLGYYVGELTAEPRIIRQRFTASLKPRKTPPAPPARLSIAATIPLAPMMGDLRFGVIDILLVEPQRLHTLDAGENRQDID